MSSDRRVAVVGSGVSGLVAAHEMSREVRVTLFEADTRLGGHADTHDVDGLTIDTGFIVHNRRTYPHLLRIFAELDVATQESEMSLSMRSDDDQLEWAGALGRRGLFPARSNLSRPAYLRMLTEIPRFHRAARRLLATPEQAGDPGDPGETLGEFLARGGFTPFFRRHFMAPMVAAVWSCDPKVALDYPARYLFTFLAHHGMLQVFGSPQWRTVTGGSREYVERIVAGLDDVRTGTKVVSVCESAEGVEITDGNGVVEHFEAVVIATHPAQSVSMLADPTEAQREILESITYSPNVALLHTDTSVMPRARNAWAAWNHLERPGHDGVTVTYDLTRLQRLDTDTHYLVTLGGEDLVDPATVIARRDYEHPLYTPASVSARARQRELDTERIHFAGAWQGWGFHEDGARSGVEAARRVLATRPGPLASVPEVALGVHATTVRHTRRTPWKRSFSHRSRHWVVDLDALPDHGLRGRFESRDHLGHPDATIRSNVENFLATQGIHLDGGRILMAAQPRAWGFCFNPISVFWCFSAAGALAAQVVEVHNTYGDRHAYLVHPDAAGDSVVDKAMYVSPFHGTDGRYAVHAPVPVGELRIAVSLTTGRDRFDASVAGVPDTARGAITRASFASLRGALLIRAHGLALWARRLPIQPRPTHLRQKSVQ